MTIQAFLNKWHDLNAQGWWAETPSRLFWARSYQMPQGLLLEMSQDLLSIPEFANPELRHGDSSVKLARRTMGEAMS